MKIKKTKSQHTRYFQAEYECEHCGSVESGYGYNDPLFHSKVIPAMKCGSCGKTASDYYRPLAPKYNEGVQLQTNNSKELPTLP